MSVRPSPARIGLITGGTKGIGLAIAERLAADFDVLVLNYAHDDRAAAAAAELVEAKGAEAHLVRGDVGTAEGIGAVATAVAGRSGRLELLVHGAAWPVSTDPLTVPLDHFERAVRTNGSSLLHLVRAVMHRMGDGSSVVFLSSHGAKTVIDGYLALGVPKALGEALVRYLAVALAPEGVSVNSVSPAGVPTDAVRAVLPDPEARLERLRERTPWPRTVAASDVAEVVAALWEGRLPTVTGQDIVMDGGLYLRS
jgi:enoyl-[acyl-carrier protein] reductase III